MENASKALIMAGSILIALLVISLLVWGYYQLSGLEQTKENSKIEDSMLKIMKQFEQYNRGDGDLYGSELLSLANLKDNYNNLDAGDGYGEINIYVELKKEISGSEYFKTGKHDIEYISEDYKKLKDNMEQYEVEKKEYNYKSVRYYSLKSYREIAIDFGIDFTSEDDNDSGRDISENILLENSKTKQLVLDIQEYERLKLINNTFKTGKRFKCTKVEYNNNNGRIAEMYFEEV